MTWRDPKWPEVAQKWRHLTGSHLEVAVEGLWSKFTVHLYSYRAVTRRRWQSRDRKWLQVTTLDRKWPEVTSFDRKSRGSGSKWPIRQVLGTFELLQGCNSQVDVTWQEITLRHPTWPEVTSFPRKSPGSGCRRRISQVLGTFELLQGCNSQEVAVTWQEMTSRDPKWP